jgi:hypothetical protein
MLNHSPPPAARRARPAGRAPARAVALAGLIVLGLGATACDSAAPSADPGGAQTSGGASAASPSGSGPTRSGSGQTSAGTGPASGAKTPPGGPAPSGVRVIAITVTGRDVRPAPSRVEIEVGELLRLTVTADREDELHVHGFEVERELTPGKAALVELRGERPGLYEVETHSPPLRLLQVVVR